MLMVLLCNICNYIYKHCVCGVGYIRLFHFFSERSEVDFVFFPFLCVSLISWHFTLAPSPFDKLQNTNSNQRRRGLKVDVTFSVVYI